MHRIFIKKIVLDLPEFGFNPKIYRFRVFNLIDTLKKRHTPNKIFLWKYKNSYSEIKTEDNLKINKYTD